MERNIVLLGLLPINHEIYSNYINKIILEIN